MQTSPTALMTAIEAPSPENAAREALLADEVSTEALDPVADAHPRAAIEPGISAGNADQPVVALGSTAEAIDVPVVIAAQTRRRASLVPADLASAGATLQAFLLNEGLAAFSHWRALATVRSPAEAVRLHVDEMQRAAEASLTCMNRIVGHLGRSAAAA